MTICPGIRLDEDEVFVSDGAKSDTEISRRYLAWTTKLPLPTLYILFMLTAMLWQEGPESILRMVILRI